MDVRRLPLRLYPPRMAPRRIFRGALRCVCITVVVLVVLSTILTLIISYTLLQAALNVRRAYWMETDYQIALKFNDTLRPAIEDVRHLYFWSDEDDRLGELIHRLFSPIRFDPSDQPQKTIRLWDEELRLFPEGTGMPNVYHKETWIYLAGTSPDEEEDASSFHHKFKRHDGVDPEYINMMYRDAFNKVVERWHGTSSRNPGPSNSARVGLRYADCDVSPMTCGSFGLSGVNLLVHMKITDDCVDTNRRRRCRVVWRWIGLPLMMLPWSRQVRIPLDGGGSTVVPAFPSAEEQLWSLMAQSGAEQGISYWPELAEYEDFLEDPENYRLPEPPLWQNWNTILVVDPTPGNAILAWPVDVNLIGEVVPFAFFNFLQFTLSLEWVSDWEWLELETVFWITCTAERWLDIVLRWWDSVPDIVRPRSCAGEVELKKRAMEREREAWENLEKKEKEREKLRDAWNKQQEALGLDPNWI